MTLQFKLIAWLLSLVAVGAVLFGAYHYGRHVQELEDSVLRNAAVQEQEQKNQAALAAYDEKIKKSGEQHDTDQITVNTLHDQLGRVRIHIPTGCAVPTTPQPGTDSGGASGVLPENVDGLFADLQGRVDALVQRCDQLNIDAIRQNAEVR